MFAQIVMYAQSIWFGIGGVHLEGVSVGLPSCSAQAHVMPVLENAGKWRRKSWPGEPLPSFPYQWS